MMTLGQSRWTAIVLAGQRPGPDRLAEHFGEAQKALIKVGGEAMVTRVIRTLSAVPEIGSIVILTQVPELIQHAALAGGDVTFHVSGAGISASIKAIAGSQTAPWPVFVTTADHPLLTPEMVQEFLQMGAASDLSVGMVEKAVMLKAFPEAKRTWLKFSDGHWSGANLFAMRTDRVTGALDLWAAAEKDRKSAWRLFLHFGPWLALRAITRTIGLRNALKTAGQKFGLSATLVAMSDPVACIDVDKPEDHAMAEAIVLSRP
jgi:CTP:molybdopterin cytidylyltransferase MocA